MVASSPPLVQLTDHPSPRIEVTRERVNPRMLLQQVAAIFEPEARAKNVAFEWRVAGNLPTDLTCAADDDLHRKALLSVTSPPVLPDAQPVVNLAGGTCQLSADTASS